jgi:cystathionine beta-lyase/cystathionine gamma-synthase
LSLFSHQPQPALSITARQSRATSQEHAISTRTRSGRAIATRAIHDGLSPDPATGAILTPIYQTTTYVQEAVGKHKGYCYSRTSNPTVAALEAQLGALEDAPPAVCFATGLAAISALFLSTLKQGGHVVVSDVVYGGTVRLLRQILANFGVTCSLVDTSDPEAVQAAIAANPATRLVFIETPANPTLKLTDIAAVARVTKAAGVPLAVDNTFLTPVAQDCFSLGADVVVYSTTKYIEGHNATVGGAIVTRDERLLERLRLAQNTLGARLSAQEAFLTLRGIKTLPLRMRQHSANALQVARWLEAHPHVRQVRYPFLESFPQRELALRQQRDGGGMIAFEVRGGGGGGVALLNSLKLIALAENLGSVESLVTHPATMTHGSYAAEERARLGITDGLVRLSVGLEDPADLIEDLEQGLAAACGTPASSRPVRGAPAFAGPAHGPDSSRLEAGVPEGSGR